MIDCDRYGDFPQLQSNSHIVAEVVARESVISLKSILNLSLHVVSAQIPSMSHKKLECLRCAHQEWLSRGILVSPRKSLHKFPRRCFQFVSQSCTSIMTRSKNCNLSLVVKYLPSINPKDLVRWQNSHPYPYWYRYSMPQLGKEGLFENSCSI